MQRGVLSGCFGARWGHSWGTSKLLSMAIKLYPAAMRVTVSNGSACRSLAVHMKCRIPALQDLAFNIMQMRIIQLCIIFGRSLHSRTCISTEVA